MNDSQEMLDFVKAMSDADRLRIIGVLTLQPASQADIVARLGLPPRDVFQHLSFLTQVGVVTQEDDLYALNTSHLESMAREQLSQERPTYVPAPDLDADSRKTLTACLNPDGTIKRLPPKGSKLDAILNYLVNAFTPGASYTEKEVNMIIRRFHVDVSGLRRDLVDAGLLERERDGSRYWRAQEKPE
jgi:hypothetical protein